MAHHDGAEIGSMYPLNNNGDYIWPSPESLTSLVQIASLPQVGAAPVLLFFQSQVRSLLTNEHGTNFTTFVMWAYSAG